MSRSVTPVRNPYIPTTPTGGMDVNSFNSWIDSHNREYAKTAARLAATKAKFLSVDEHEAVELLDMSYHNAVISQQTPVDRHEEGYVHWLRTGQILDTVNYANQKTRWLNSTNVLHKYNAVRMLQKNQVKKAWRYMADNFVGLGPMKAAFTLAMLGFESVFCIDTNVAQLMGWDGRTISNMSIDRYEDAMGTVLETFSDIDMSPFMLQWSLFDFKRGNHSDHKVWFVSTGTWMD